MIFGILGQESSGIEQMERALLYRLRTSPIREKRKKLSLQLDGEIYNRAELAGLLGLPRDATNSDVIIEGYRRWKEGLFDRINGPFAVVLHDEEQDKLILCRDRFGLRPLYYAYRQGEGIAFASELRALLRCPWINHEPDQSAIQEYMVFGHVAGSKTFYREISELEPGHLLDVKRDRIFAKKREVLPISLCPDHDLSLESATDSLSLKLVEAMGRQMEAIDFGARGAAVPEAGAAVPEAGAVVFLSGGVDSSVLVALFRNCIIAKEDQIVTYSVSLPGYRQDEWQYAKEIIERFRCEAHELPFGPEPMAEAWPRLISFFKEPLTSTNTISWYLSARMASMDGRFRIFSGEGADGLFSGGLYKAEIEAIGKGAIGEDQGVIFCQSHVLNPPDLIGRVMEGSLNIEQRERIWQRSRKRHHELPVEYAQIAYHLRTTGNRLLTRAERMASAHRVSLLLPYMDLEVVRLILSIPYDCNNLAGAKKYPLKRIGEALFGKDLSFRRKVGFPFPVRGWLRDRKGKGLGELVEMLLEKRSLNRGIYKGKAFKKELERRMAGEVKPMDWLLWSAINVELWFRLCVENYKEEGDRVFS